LIPFPPRRTFNFRSALWVESHTITKARSLEEGAGNVVQAQSSIKALASSPHVKSLQELDLSDNELGIGAVQALAEFAT